MPILKTFVLLHRFAWFRLPAGLLLVLLQRTPAVRVAATAEHSLIAAPVGTLLRAAGVAIASLGAVDTLVGATQFLISRASPISGTVGQAITPVSFTYSGTPSAPRSFRVTGTLPPGLSFSPAMSSNGVVNSGTPVIAGTPSQSGSFTIQVQGFNGLNATGDTNNVRVSIAFAIAAAPAVAPVFSTQPASQSAGWGGAVVFASQASGSPTYQWQRNGTNLAQPSTATLSLGSVQPENTGVYSVVATTAAGTATSDTAILGLTSNVKLVGAGTEFADIFHAGTGFTYDQILLEGGAAAVTADPGQILRLSFVDLNDDIVQVEFSGPGTLSVVLDAVTGPAAPVKYNQAINYLRGHAGIVLTDATADTHLSIFSVGRANAVNQALFRDDTTYDGYAGLAFVAIQSADGHFGGLRAANANFFSTQGLTGVFAPDVHFTGPVFIGDITASDQARPVLQIGSGADVRITGGDLFQANGRAVEVSGISGLQFAAGSSSHGASAPAQGNQAQLVEDGTDVTGRIVVGP